MTRISPSEPAPSGLALSEPARSEPAPGSAAGAEAVVTTVPPRRGRAVALTILKKVGAAAVVLWGAATVAFFAQLALPGDRATTMRFGGSQRKSATVWRTARRPNSARPGFAPPAASFLTTARIIQKLE